MVQVWKRPKYPNRWEEDVSVDPRFDGLLALSNAICDIFDVSWAEEDGRPLDYSEPLELAARLREAADHIECLTRPA